MRNRLLVIGLGVAVLVTLGFWGLASASGFRTGSTVTVEKHEVVNSTLWMSGQTLDVAGEVNGDVFCAGQNVTISGTVRGDVLCAAQTIVISGLVTGDVRAAAQTVTAGGTVLHNFSALAQSFNQSSKSDIRGDLSVAANDVSQNGVVGRDTAMAATTIRLGGEIKRNVRVTVESLSLGSGARIRGNLNYTSPSNVQTARGAVVSGKTTKTAPQNELEGKKGTPSAGFRFGMLLYVLAAGLLVSLVLVLLFPRAIHAATEHGFRMPWKPLLVGFIASIVVPALIILLILSLVGIPLGLILLLAWALIEALAGILFAYYLGRLILRSQRNPVLIMLVGAVLLLLLYFIPVIGLIAFIVAMLMGTGMLLLELARRRRFGSKQELRTES